MMRLALLAVLLGAPPTVERFWPCVPGHTIRYRVEKHGERLDMTVTETVRGPKAPHLCVVDRTIERPGEPAHRDAFVIERHPDRLMDAGELGHTRAFRAPLLKAPLAEGAQWVFNRVRYRLTAVGATVETPAGRFEGCVRVEAKATDEDHLTAMTYCPDKGPVVKVIGPTRLEAVRLGGSEPPESSAKE